MWRPAVARDGGPPPTRAERFLRLATREPLILPDVGDLLAEFGPAILLLLGAWTFLGGLDWLDRATNRPPLPPRRTRPPTPTGAPRILLLLFAALLVGCSSATTPSPSPTTLAIVPPDDLLTVQKSLTYMVVGTFPDGSTHQVDATWVTDNPAVATVKAGGIVTGVGPGSVTLIATVNGQIASRVVRVVPDFTGTWSGQSLVTGCSAGDFRTCGRCCPNWQMHTMSLTLNQVRDVVSGTLQFDAPATTTTAMYVGLVSGPIQLTGELVLQGTLTGQLSNAPAFAGPTLFDWSTTIDTSATSMVGHFTRISDAGPFFPTRVSYSVALTKAAR